MKVREPVALFRPEARTAQDWLPTLRFKGHSGSSPTLGANHGCLIDWEAAGRRCAAVCLAAFTALRVVPEILEPEDFLLVGEEGKFFTAVGGA